MDGIRLEILSPISEVPTEDEILKMDPKLIINDPEV